MTSVIDDMQEEQVSVVAVCPAVGLQVTLQLFVCVRGTGAGTGCCPSASSAFGLQSAVGSVHSRSARASLGRSMGCTSSLPQASSGRSACSGLKA